VLQLALLLLPQKMPLPVFLLHFGVQVRSKQGEGHSGPLSLYSELEVEEGFLFTLTTEILCSALLQGPLAALLPPCSELSLRKGIVKLMLYMRQE